MGQGGAGAALHPLGVAVCNFRVATKRPAGRNEAGERTFETAWTAVEAWDKRAEQCSRFIHKDSRVRETGQKRLKTILRAEEIVATEC